MVLHRNMKYNDSFGNALGCFGYLMSSPKFVPLVSICLLRLDIGEVNLITTPMLFAGDRASNQGITSRWFCLAVVLLARLALL